MDVTEEDPTKLRDRYARIFQSITVNKRSNKAAKSIWTWIILARRPLSIQELRCAVELDLETKLLDTQNALSKICRELVTIGPDGSVNLTHETIRQVLLDQSISSEITVDEAHGHTRIAITLLKLLSGNCLLQFPFNTTARLASTSSFDPSLLDYAATYFSEHIACCIPDEDRIMEELCKFLQGNVLLWIEHVENLGDLSVITRAASNLCLYSERRAKIVPTDDSINIVKEWVTKLPKVAERLTTQTLVSGWDEAFAHFL